LKPFQILLHTTVLLFSDDGDHDDDDDDDDDDDVDDDSRLRLLCLTFPAEDLCQCIFAQCTCVVFS
jgi:hypothetical protein